MGSPNISSLEEMESEVRKFNAVFPDLVRELREMYEHQPELNDALEWFEEVSRYNVPHKRVEIELALVMTYKSLVDQSKCTEEDLRKSRILAWCLGWGQGAVFIADDIIDGSTTRRGKTCWYRKDDVGMAAVKDYIYLESAIFAILKKHFSSHSCYVQMLELFHECIMSTTMGWCLESTTTSPKGTMDFSKYTFERYMDIAKWKSGYFTCLPVRMALFMAGICEEQAHLDVEAVMLHLGIFTQVENDYEDCYADSKVIGKIGTDIEDGTCTWLITQALTRVDKDQRKTLEANYGKNDKESVSRVKSVYRELDMTAIFTDFKKKSYDEALHLIQNYKGVVSKEMFKGIASKIYHMDKGLVYRESSQ